MDSFPNVAEFNEVKETIQQLLKWGWKYNRNLEEQAAQLHMLSGWSQIVEVDCFPKKLRPALVIIDYIPLFQDITYLSFFFWYALSVLF